MELKEDSRQNVNSAYVFEKNKSVKEIAFRNVRFKYPCSENYTLENISFRMTSGKRYAFIGENGAGKTTIVKLLLGLYDNYEGDIFINDTNIRNMPLEELYSHFSQESRASGFRKVSNPAKRQFDYRLRKFQRTKSIVAY